MSLRDELRAAARDYRRLPAELRHTWQQATSEWWDLIAEIRQDRQITRRMWQKITGKQQPSWREKRRAERAFRAESAELDAIAKRVITEYEHGEG